VMVATGIPAWMQGLRRRGTRGQPKAGAMPRL
jgi:hypothetical protein